MTTALTVRNLYKVFGNDDGTALDMAMQGQTRDEIQQSTGCVVALQDVSFEVAEREIFVVMGLSGSGKSTLVRCLNRLLEPSSGEILLGDQDVLAADEVELREMRRRRISMVFQHYGLLPHRTVIDNVAWGLEVRGMSKQERYAAAQKTLEVVGLSEWVNSRTFELSGGMQQRVGLARALTVEPDVLLMDEPFSGLDPLIRTQMQDELIRLQEEIQQTIVFITHDLDEALKLGDRIAIMRDGRIIQMDSPDQIVLNPEDEYVADFTESVQSQTVLTAADIAVDAGRPVTRGSGPRDALQAILDNNDGTDVFIVDEDQHYSGVSYLDDLVSAVEQGESSLDGLVKDVRTVPGTVPYDQLLPVVLAQPEGVPVISEEGEILGVVYAQTLATTLNDEAPAPGTQLPRSVRRTIEEVLNREPEAVKE